MTNFDVKKYKKVANHIRSSSRQRTQNGLYQGLRMAAKKPTRLAGPLQVTIMGAGIATIFDICCRGSDGSREPRIRQRKQKQM